MNDDFRNYVELKKERLAGDARFTVITEEPKEILSDDEIDELVKCYARMLAYEYIGAHPELFKKTDTADFSSGNQPESDTETLYSGGDCAIITADAVGGDLRWVA